MCVTESDVSSPRHSFGAWGVQRAVSYKAIKMVFYLVICGLTAASVKTNQDAVLLNPQK